MARHCVVLIDAEPDSLAAAAWAASACEKGDLIELLAPWRRGQTEVDPASGAFVDAPTAARLRLLSALDRIRAMQPDARLTLTPAAGSPHELVPTIEADLLVVGGRRSRRLVRSARCPLVIVRGHSQALLVAATGLRQEATFDAVRRLTRP